MNTKVELTADDNQMVEQTIAEVEKQTSAEIKVVVLQHCWIDIREKARQQFHKLELHQTDQRNAVMILLVTRNREFLVYGDKGIHEKVGPEFWLQTRDAMLDEFKQGRIAQGLCVGIRTIGEQLNDHFPISKDDRNELDNEVVYE